MNIKENSPEKNSLKINDDFRKKSKTLLQFKELNNINEENKSIQKRKSLSSADLSTKRFDLLHIKNLECIREFFIKQKTFNFFGTDKMLNDMNWE